MILRALGRSKFFTFSRHLSSRVSAFCRLSRLWSWVSMTSKMPSRKRGMKLSRSTFSILNTKLVHPRQSCRIMGFLNFILLANSSTKLPTFSLSWWCEVISFNSRSKTCAAWRTSGTTSPASLESPSKIRSRYGNSSSLATLATLKSDSQDKYRTRSRSRWSVPSELGSARKGPGGPPGSPNKSCMMCSRKSPTLLSSPMAMAPTAVSPLFTLAKVTPGWKQ
mmetsp:Transcript_66238/g.104881  ORF Transcript_66238/g.104881 Transcript_66238/m.104881 type:complete len:222 (+) Transcript_66238:1550-2215(+)